MHYSIFQFASTKASELGHGKAAFEPVSLRLTDLATYIPGHSPRVLVFLALSLLPQMLSAAQKSRGTIEAGNIRITFDERGVGGIASPNDPHGAVVVPGGQRLGWAVRYRKLEPPPPPEPRRRGGNDAKGDAKGDDAAKSTPLPKPVSPAVGEWVNMPADALQYYATPDENELIYATPVTSDLPLRVVQRFRVVDGALDWTIELASTSEYPIEIGDLAVVVPWQGPTGGNQAAIFERGYTKHQFIEGDGSFIYFTRASGTPPYLLVTARPGTKLEYFGSVAGVGGGRPPRRSARRRWSSWRRQATVAAAVTKLAGIKPTEINRTALRSHKIKMPRLRPRAIRRPRIKKAATRRQPIAAAATAPPVMRAARRGRGTSGVYIHSAEAAASVPRGTWRQKNTSLKLAAAGTEGDRVQYGFRFQFADSPGNSVW